MKSIERIKLLSSTAKTLETLEENYKKAISNESCDKYELKFGGDDRFSVFSCKVSLTCYTGYYGSSGCSTFANVAPEIANRILNKVLNRRMSEILEDMAKEARLEAKDLYDAAKKELEFLSEQLEECNDT